MKLFKTLWAYVKDPLYPQRYYPGKLCKTLFFELLKLDVLLVAAAAAITTVLLLIFDIDAGENANEKLFEDYGALAVVFFGIVLAPLIEEMIFRAPLVLFKNSKAYPLFFYLSVLLFGLIHIFNFENFEKIIWFFPLLVLPQLVVGVFLGFIRVKMGLKYAIFFHAAHNLIFLGPVIIYEVFTS